MDTTDATAVGALPGPHSPYVFDRDLVTYVCEVETLAIDDRHVGNAGPRHLPVWRITVYGITRSMRDVKPTDLQTIENHDVFQREVVRFVKSWSIG